MLITGSNGFLGKQLYNSYKDLFNVITLSRKNSDLNIDLENDIIKSKINVDIVIHAAGKAHVIPKTKEEIESFYNVNFHGTKKLINSLENVKSFIFISSVSVYGLETGKNINEDCNLEGKTPYAKSKIQAEELLISWAKENNVNLLILRLPLLAGKNPPGNLGAMINAIKKGTYFSISSGQAKRSVVLVEDIVGWLSDNLMSAGVFNLTDNNHPSFRDLEIVISNQLNKRLPFSIPISVAKCIGYLGDILRVSFVNSYRIDKMTNDLTFSSERATKTLNWQPKQVKSHFLIS